MPEVISNTSPLQYLHQLGHLELLRDLSGAIIAPRAVVEELSKGRDHGIDLPHIEALDWITIKIPKSTPALPLVTDLGPGEREVLALGMETTNATLILDDGLARRVAHTLGLSFRGTLGILLDAKNAGMINEVKPLLDRLQALNFRVSPKTRQVILGLAGESP